MRILGIFILHKGVAREGNHAEGQANFHNLKLRRSISGLAAPSQAHREEAAIAKAFLSIVRGPSLIL